MWLCEYNKLKCSKILFMNLPRNIEGARYFLSSVFAVRVCAYRCSSDQSEMSYLSDSSDFSPFHTPHTFRTFQQKKGELRDTRPFLQLAIALFPKFHRQ